MGSTIVMLPVKAVPRLAEMQRFKNVVYKDHEDGYFTVSGPTTAVALALKAGGCRV